MVRPATRHDLSLFLGTPVAAFATDRYGATAAIGLIVERPDGRHFVHLDTSTKGLVLNIFWEARQVVRQARKPLYAACAELQFPKAPKLLRLLGFKPTDEVQADGKRVWLCE